LQRTRSSVSALMRLRRTVVRQHRNSHPALEVAVAVNYTGFLLMCRILEFVIWWRGPFFVHSMAGQASRFAQDFSYLCGSALGNLSAEQRRRMQSQWAS
jgi:hypothetical protein